MPQKPMKEYFTIETITNYLKLTGALLGTTFLLAVLQPSVRARIRHALGIHDRTILATTTASFGQRGLKFEIVKVKTPQTLNLEFYRLAKNGTSRLFQRIAMKDARDGYLNFHGQALNLLVEKLTKHSQPQILAPSFDHNMVAHLNVFQFDPISRRFVRASASRAL